MGGGKLGAETAAVSLPSAPGGSGEAGDQQLKNSTTFPPFTAQSASFCLSDQSVAR